MIIQKIHIQIINIFINSDDPNLIFFQHNYDLNTFTQITYLYLI